jgi:hypothetical protein
MESKFSYKCRALLLMLFTATIALQSGLAAPKILQRGNTDKQIDSIRFSWSFVSVIPINKKRFNVSFFTADTSLASGTSIKMHLVPHSKCFIYLFAQWAQGNIELLLPSTVEEMGKPIDSETSYSYPKTGWSTLDPIPGKETFYLIVSSTPLKNIEEAYRKLASTPPESAATYTRMFLQNLRTTMKSSLKHYAVIADIPAEIGGAVRGMRENLPLSLKEIDLEQVVTKSLYAKKIVITHTR